METLYKGEGKAHAASQIGSLEEYIQAHRKASRINRSKAKQGERSLTAKLTEATVIEIRKTCF